MRLHICAETARFSAAGGLDDGHRHKRAFCSDRYKRPHGEEPPVLPNLPKRKSSDDIAWGSAGKDARFLNKLRRLLSKAEVADRKLIMHMAQKMARPNARRAASN